MTDFTALRGSRAQRQEQLRGAAEAVEETTGLLRFLYKHKHKLAIGGAVVLAGAAAYAYFQHHVAKDGHEEGHGDDSNAHGMAVQAVGPNGRPGARELSKPGQRSRMLLRIRKQFDLAIKQFLPTMRLKVAEGVDVSTAIRKIKELRAGDGGRAGGGPGHAAGMAEALLWEEVRAHACACSQVDGSDRHAFAPLRNERSRPVLDLSHSCTARHRSRCPRWCSCTCPPT